MILQNFFVLLGNFVAKRVGAIARERRYNVLACVMGCCSCPFS
jgi:hypothetical protein